jgi:hypothetical protein
MNPREGSYTLSKSGLEQHYTYPIEEGNRIIISFGFLIPKEHVDTMISIDPTIIPHSANFEKIHAGHISTLRGNTSIKSNSISTDNTMRCYSTIMGYRSTNFVSTMDTPL